MSDAERDGTRCLICYEKIGLSKDSVRIFNNHEGKSKEKPLIKTVCWLLEREITAENAHSEVLCKKCCKLCNEYEGLKNRMMGIKEELWDQYRSTVKKIGKLENISDECNDHDYLDSVDHPGEDEEHKNADDGKLIVKREKVDNENENEDDENEMDDDKHEQNDDKNQETKEENETGAKEIPEIMLEEHLDEQFLQEDLITDHVEQTKLTEVYLDEYTPVVVKSEDGVKEDENVSIDMISSAEKISRLKDKELCRQQIPQKIVSRDEETYTCLLCKKDESPVSGCSKEIVTHMKQIHDARLYICDICGDDFRKRNELSIHLDDHVAREEGDFQCEVCNRIFSNLRLFRIHRRIHYPQVKSWSCDTCGKRYSSKNLLDEHVNTHMGVRPYICEVCGKDFASKYTFKAHAKTHEVRARPYECNQCPKTFLSQQNLNQHEKTHLGVKEHICHVCGKAFGSSHNLEVHNIVHTGYKPFICKICGKKFARKAEIRDHERTHTGEKPYQCEYCGATFSQRSNLQSHKRATHYNDKRYKCNDCGKGFKRRRLLDYHIKAAHTGERPFKCETCSATFVYPEHFKKHMRIHTGEKPYLCEVCGKAFNSRDNRNAHRFIHSDKKPYECLVCGMGFMRKPLLYAHMQTQNHLNDTIVVNQPRLTSDENPVLLPGEDVELLMEEDADELDETEIYVTDLKEHVIIAESDQMYDNETELELDNAEEGIDEDVQQLVVNNQMTFAEGEVVHCKADEGGQVYSYTDGEEGTIVVSTGAEYKELIGDSNNPVRLVQIRIPTTGVDGKNWLSLVQQNT